MNRDETSKIISLMMQAWKYYKPENQEAEISLWESAFSDCSYENVEEAVFYCVRNDKYCPGIARVGEVVKLLKSEGCAAENAAAYRRFQFDDTSACEMPEGVRLEYEALLKSFHMKDIPSDAIGNEIPSEAPPPPVNDPLARMFVSAAEKNGFEASVENESGLLLLKRNGSSEISFSVSGDGAGKIIRLRNDIRAFARKDAGSDKAFYYFAQDFSKQVDNYFVNAWEA